MTTLPARGRLIGTTHQAGSVSRDSALRRSCASRKTAVCQSCAGRDVNRKRKIHYESLRPVGLLWKLNQY